MGFIHPAQLGTLLSLAGKPQSRSEWEARFAHWQKKASETEEAKIEAASARVRQALQRSTFLRNRDWRIVPQGSYHNNTNVRSDSDVDLAVCLTDSFFYDVSTYEPVPPSDVGLFPLGFSFQDFKADLTGCMAVEFGAVNTISGSKAIHLHKDTATHVSVDVVPAFTYRLYGERGLGGRSVIATGISLETNEGERKTNYPEQHYINGCAKNDRTGRRYKRVVRILKRLRNHMADNSSFDAALRSYAKGAASYLIESLVYNCPDRLFGNASIYDDVVAVLRYLFISFDPNAASTLLGGSRAYSAWTEVNGIKGLLQTGQAWTANDVRGFVLAALTYMDA